MGTGAMEGGPRIFEPLKDTIVGSEREMLGERVHERLGISLEGESVVGT
jgi:hypothetical protein